MAHVTLPLRFLTLARLCRLAHQNGLVRRGELVSFPKHSGRDTVEIVHSGKSLTLVRPAVIPY